MVTTHPRLAGVAPIPSRIQLSSRALAVLALCVANLVWAGSPAASKAALPEVGPLAMGAFRAGIAVVVFALLLAYRRERPATGHAPALLGLFGVTLFCAFQNYGLLIADATTTALIGGAMFSMLGRRAYARHEVLAILTGSMAWGLIFLAPAMIAEVVVVGVRVPSSADALAIIYLGAGCSGLAFLLWGYGLRHIAAAETAVIGNLEVAIGIAAAAIVTGVVPTAVQLAGGALVLAGAYLVSIPARSVAAWQPRAWRRHRRAAA